VLHAAAPIVFVVDDDISVRESLESLIRTEGWQPETFASAQDLRAHESLFPLASFLMFLFRALTVSTCRNASPSNELTCQSSSSPATVMCR
jgi:hypothetical protein